MLLSLSLRTVVLVVIGLGRVECSGFNVLLKIVLGCSLLCLCSLAGGGCSWCCCSIHLHCCGGTHTSRTRLLSLKLCPPEETPNKTVNITAQCKYKQKKFCRRYLNENPECTIQAQHNYNGIIHLAF